MIERLICSGDPETDLRAYVESAWAARAACEPTANAARLARWRARFGPDDRLWANERPLVVSSGHGTHRSGVLPFPFARRAQFGRL